MSLAQEPAGVIGKRLDHRLLHGIGIDLEQKVRATLQIEPEDQTALRPSRPGLHESLREEIGHDHQAYREDREQYRCGLPSREIQHDAGAPRQREIDKGCPPGAADFARSRRIKPRIAAAAMMAGIAPAAKISARLQCIASMTPPAVGPMIAPMRPMPSAHPT